LSTATPAYDQSVSPFGVKIPFVEHLGIELVLATKERAIISLDRRPELTNSLGTTHGGVLMTMLDLVMTCAVRGHYGVAGGVVTVDMSVGFMAPATGKVLAEARVLHGGRSTCFVEGEAKDESGKLLAKAIGTFKMVGERK
jgi:uncharacterized protein (TIGR00369 family)